MEEQIIKEYDENYRVYNDTQKSFVQLIQELLIQNDIKYHSIDGRVKDRESLIKKIQTKDSKYNSISEITDIIGIRIITYFSDEVDKIASLLSNEFDIDNINSTDKRLLLDPDRFGYLSLHYILSLDDRRSNLLEYRRSRDTKIEVQIRSILQHTWAEINHDLGYKTSLTIPKNVRREFSRLASLLELADEEFLRIRNKLDEYKKYVDSADSCQSSALEIDGISIKAFIAENSSINELHQMIHKNFNTEIYEPLNYDSVISKLEYCKINTIGELERLINKYKNEIQRVTKAIIANNQGELPDYVTIFYACYVKIIVEQSYEDFIEYMHENNIGAGDETEDKPFYEKLRNAIS